jgi:hypothetical protein
MSTDVKIHHKHKHKHCEQNPDADTDTADPAQILSEDEVDTTDTTQQPAKPTIFGTTGSSI